MYHLNVYLYPPTSASPSQDFLPAVCLSSPLSAIHRHIQAHLSAPCQFLLCLILHRKSSVQFRISTRMIMILRLKLTPPQTRFVRFCPLCLPSVHLFWA